MSTQPPHSRGRDRWVYQQWLRDPKGPMLPRPPPDGVRPPNDLIWGHTLEDFFWLERLPGVDMVTIWSRSMIKEYGERYEESEFTEPDALQVPRLRRPWPVLKVRGTCGRVPKDAYEVVDEGCTKALTAGHPPKRRDDYDGDNADDHTHEAHMAEFREAAEDMLGYEAGKDVLSCNDPHYPLRSPDGGHIYAFLYTKRPSFESGVGPGQHYIAQLEAGNLLFTFDRFGVIALSELTDYVSPSHKLEVIHNQDKEKDELSVVDPVPHDSPFSIEGVPKLEEDIPRPYFPDTLYVHDPHNMTRASEETTSHTVDGTPTPQLPLVYKRVLPALPRDKICGPMLPSSPARPAHLHLARQHRLGAGHHSLVHGAALTLPPPLSAYSRTGAVRVAAKTAFPVASARELLAAEAQMYAGFPAHLSQDWCGYNLVTPIRHPVPVGPVVPKCYGYYVPTRDGEELCDPLDVDAPSPILLLEECGKPIEPEDFTLDQRYVLRASTRRVWLISSIG